MSPAVAAKPSERSSTEIYKVFLWLMLIYGASAGLALLLRTEAPELVRRHAWLDALALQGTMMALTLSVIHWQGLDWREAGFRLPSGPYPWAGMFLLGLAAGLVLTMLANAWSLAGAASTGRWWRVEFFLWTALFCPVAEEIYLRGWFQTRLARFWGAGVKVVFASALVFGALHVFWGFRGKPWDATMFQVFTTFLFGLVLARSRQRTGSLLPPIVFHIALNASYLLIR